MTAAEAAVAAASCGNGHTVTAAEAAAVAAASCRNGDGCWSAAAAAAAAAKADFDTDMNYVLDVNSTLKTIAKDDVLQIAFITGTCEQYRCLNPRHI